MCLWETINKRRRKRNEIKAKSTSNWSWLVRLRRQASNCAVWHRQCRQLRTHSPGRKWCRPSRPRSSEPHPRPIRGWLDPCQFWIGTVGFGPCSSRTFFRPLGSTNLFLLYIERKNTLKTRFTDKFGSLSDFTCVMYSNLVSRLWFRSLKNAKINKIRFFPDYITMYANFLSI